MILFRSPILSQAVRGDPVAEPLPVTDSRFGAVSPKIATVTATGSAIGEGVDLGPPAGPGHLRLS